MSRAFGLSAHLPDDLNPAVDTCTDCGDVVAWCPIWTAKWPDLERFRNE